jgi:hypothetical protein
MSTESFLDSAIRILHSVVNKGKFYISILKGPKKQTLSNRLILKNDYDNYSELIRIKPTPQGRKIDWI